MNDSVVRSRDVALRHFDVALTVHDMKNECQLSEDNRAIITLGRPERDLRYSWSSKSLERIRTKGKTIPINDLNYQDAPDRAFKIA